MSIYSFVDTIVVGQAVKLMCTVEIAVCAQSFFSNMIFLAIFCGIGSMALMSNTKGEVLRAERTRCKMTQEFVAESLGVSRQAVSKWENGVADPSTSNLFALAKLYGVSAEDLLRWVAPQEEAEEAR